jgi:hypothetical protein
VTGMSNTPPPQQPAILGRRDSNPTEPARLCAVLDCRDTPVLPDGQHGRGRGRTPLSELGGQPVRASAIGIPIAGTPRTRFAARAHPAAPEALQDADRSTHRQRTEPSAARPQQRSLPEFPIPIGPEVEDRFCQGEADEWRYRQPQQEIPRQLGLAGTWYQPGWRRTARRARRNSNGFMTLLL